MEGADEHGGIAGEEGSVRAARAGEAAGADPGPASAAAGHRHAPPHAGPRRRAVPPAGAVRAHGRRGPSRRRRVFYPRGWAKGRGCEEAIGTRPAPLSEGGRQCLSLLRST